MYIKQKQKRFLAMMLVIVLVISGIVPQGVIQVSAQEESLPIYSGRNKHPHLTLAEHAHRRF